MKEPSLWEETAKVPNGRLMLGAATMEDSTTLKGRYTCVVAINGDSADLCYSEGNVFDSLSISPRAEQDSTARNRSLCTATSSTASLTVS